MMMMSQQTTTANNHSLDSSKKRKDDTENKKRTGSQPMIWGRRSTPSSSKKPSSSTVSSRGSSSTTNNDDTTNLKTIHPKSSVKDIRKTTPPPPPPLPSLLSSKGKVLPLKRQDPNPRRTDSDRSKKILKRTTSPSPSCEEEEDDSSLDITIPVHSSSKRLLTDSDAGCDLFGSVDDDLFIELEQDLSRLGDGKDKSKPVSLKKNNNNNNNRKKKKKKNAPNLMEISSSEDESEDEQEMEMEEGNSPSSEEVTIVTSEEKFAESLKSLSDTQRKVINLVMRGQFRHILILGKAGTGKSRLIDVVCAYFDLKSISHVKMAPTGLAAMAINGRTIHSWFGISPVVDIKSLERFNFQEHIKKILAEDGNQKDQLLTMKDCQVIIFDEVSMIDKDLLNFVDTILKILRCRNDRFGGAKAIFLGDFLQLPPVRKKKKYAAFSGGGGGSNSTALDSLMSMMIDDNDPSHAAEFWYSSLLKEAFVKENHIEPFDILSEVEEKMKSIDLRDRIKRFCSSVHDDSGFVFELDWWDSLFRDEEIFVLTQNFRQDDPVFRRILDELHFGYISNKSKRIISQRVGVFPDNRSPDIPPIRLCPVRRIADTVNSIENEKLDGRSSSVYIAHVDQKSGPRTISDDEIRRISQRYLSDSMIPEVLDLRHGTCVMCMSNTTIGSLYIPNGKRGIVTSFLTPDVREVPSSSSSYEENSLSSSRKNGAQFDRIPMVKFEGIDGLIPMKPRRWEFSEYIHRKGILVLTVDQIPLVPAYSTTIHKAQGMTLDRGLVLDIGPNSGLFGEGLIYVGLSRATKLNNVEILSIDFSRICADKSALKYTCKIYDMKGIPYKTAPSTEDEMLSDNDEDDDDKDNDNDHDDECDDELLFHDKEYELFLKNNPFIRPDKIKSTI